MAKFDGLTKNALGYWEVENKPTEAELRDYYASKYYQEAQGSYELEYSSSELAYFEAKLRQRWSAVEYLFSDPGRILDVGCGEGYALAFFDRMGWAVRGLDYSRAGIVSKNPEVADKLVEGDVFQLLTAEHSSGERYELIWLQNVLEHVLDPVALMTSLRQLMKPGGALVVTVPNDFSQLQLRALDREHIDRPFWVALPDHMSYFSRDSLKNIGEATGWNCVDVLGDFPVDWFLYHPGSNYIQNPNAGKAAHNARIEIENLISQYPQKDVTKFYSALATIGMGRDLTAIYVPENKG